MAKTVRKKRKATKDVTTVVQVSEIKGSALDTVKEMSQYELDALTLVKLRLKTWEDVKGEKLTAWKKYQDNSRSVLPRTEEVNDLQSRVFVPVTENAIRALVSKYIVALFLKKPFFRLEALGPSTDEDVAKLEKVIDSMFDSSPDFLLNFVVFVQSLLVYGTAFGKVYWRHIERNIKFRARNIETGKLEIKEKKVIKYSGFYFEPISLEHMGFDNNKKSFEDSWKLHIYWKTKQEMQALNDQATAQGLEPIYKNLDKITRGDVDQTRSQELKESARASRKESITPEPIAEYIPIECVEYWSEDSSRVILMLNRQVIGFDKLNTSWNADHPFIFSIFEPVEGEIYGRGICQKLEQEQDAVNTLFNQIIDNTKLLTNQMFIGLNGFVPVTQIIAKIGKVIMVDDMNALKELRVTPIPEAIYLLIDKMKRSMESSAGSNQLVTAIGAPITKEQTAEEVGTINRLGNELHALNIMLLEVPALDQLVKKAYHLVRQFAGEQLAARITNGEPTEDNWDTIPTEDMPYEISVKPKVGLEVMSKEKIQSDITQMIAVMANIPGYDINYLVDTYLENANIGKRIDKKKMKKQAMPQAQQQLALPEGQPAATTDGVNVTDFSGLNPLA